MATTNKKTRAEIEADLMANWDNSCDRMVREPLPCRECTGVGAHDPRCSKLKTITTRV